MAHGRRSRIEWAMWANVLAVTAAWMLMLGGLLALASGEFNRSELGIYGLLAGAFVMFVEYPRGKRMKGRTIPRQGQGMITPIVAKLGFFSSNYFIRSIMHLLLSTPAFFELPLVIGGTVLAGSGIVYFYAAIRGEHWVPLPVRKSVSGGGKTLQAPSQPPPRLPDDVRKSRAAPTRAVPRPVVAQKSAFTDLETVTARLDNPPTTAAPRPASKPKPSAKPKPAAKPKPRPATRPRPAAYSWESAVDPSTGDTYYINIRSNATQWEKPAGWDAHFGSEPRTSFS